MTLILHWGFFETVSNDMMLRACLLHSFLKSFFFSTSASSENRASVSLVDLPGYALETRKGSFINTISGTKM